MYDITHTLAVFGLGGGELIAIFLVVLLLFGAKKLPQLARGIGKSSGEFKRARDEFEREIKRAEIDTSTDPLKTSSADEPKEKIESNEN